MQLMEHSASPTKPRFPIPLSPVRSKCERRSSVLPGPGAANAPGFFLYGQIHKGALLSREKQLSNRMRPNLNLVRSQILWRRLRDCAGGEWKFNPQDVS